MGVSMALDGLRDVQRCKGLAYAFCVLSAGQTCARQTSVCIPLSVVDGQAIFLDALSSSDHSAETLSSSDHGFGKSSQHLCMPVHYRYNASIHRKSGELAQLTGRIAPISSTLFLELLSVQPSLVLKEYTDREARCWLRAPVRQ